MPRVVNCCYMLPDVLPACCQSDSKAYAIADCQQASNSEPAFELFQQLNRKMGKVSQRSLGQDSYKSAIWRGQLLFALEPQARRRHAQLRCLSPTH